jgi:teichuronic acid biosynthesis glycosyltransferase TuaG
MNCCAVEHTNSMTENKHESKEERNSGRDMRDHFRDPESVSIITPVYNAARWLPETLASVRAQTHEDWEHILVDDCSTDDSLAIIEAAARDDSRIRAVRAPRNGGPSAARNLALKAARGRFIAFLDADDLWLPEKLTRSVALLKEREYPFVYHDYRHMSHDGARVGALIPAPEKLDLRTLHTQRGMGCLCVVIDRERVPDFRFPEDCKYLHEDFCAWLGMIRGGHIGRRLPADLARYRLSKEGRSSNKLKSASETWKIYRGESKLSLIRAAFWWTQYAWNGFWLHRHARPD